LRIFGVAQLGAERKSDAPFLRIDGAQAGQCGICGFPARLSRSDCLGARHLILVRDALRYAHFLPPLQLVFKLL